MAQYASLTWEATSSIVNAGKIILITSDWIKTAGTTPAKFVPLIRHADHRGNAAVKSHFKYPEEFRLTCIIPEVSHSLFSTQKKRLFYGHPQHCRNDKYEGF